MITKITQATRLKMYMAAAMLQVMELLGWSEEEYTHFIYETGLVYLENYYNLQPNQRCSYEGEKMFWGWWKLQWYFRNEAFLKDAQDYRTKYKEDLDKDTLDAMYWTHNDPINLSNVLHPFGGASMRGMQTLDTVMAL